MIAGHRLEQAKRLGMGLAALLVFSAACFGWQHIASAVTNGPDYRRTVTFAGGNGTGNGCASESIVAVSGSQIRFGSTTWSKVASGTSCSTAKVVPAYYLTAHHGAYISGAFCGSGSAQPNTATSGITLYTYCDAVGGTITYMVRFDGGWWTPGGWVYGPTQSISVEITS